MCRDEGRSLRNPQPLGVLTRNGQRRRTDVGRDASRVRQFCEQRDDQNPRTRSNVGNRQRFIRQALRPDDVERQINDGFGIGTRIENIGRDDKIASVEFARPDNARNRLVREPALHSITDTSRIFTEALLRLRQQRCPVEPEDALQQIPRVALGRLYSGTGEGSRHQRQRRANRLVGGKGLHWRLSLGSHDRAHAALSSASIVA